MRGRARDQSKRRRWTRTTPDTYMLSARIPWEITERLRAYVDRTGDSVTDVVVVAIHEYLERHETPAEPAARATEEDASGDGYVRVIIREGGTGIAAEG